MSETEKKEERVSIKERRKKSIGTAAGEMIRDNREVLILFGVFVIVLFVVLFSMITLNMPVVPVCVIVVLEAAIAVCLHDVPIWLHGLVVIAEIVVGAFCGAALFMVLSAVVYVVGILALRCIR